MTTNTGIYQDIATRTAGDIYIGVVGPVRTGKSTFIKQFMEQLVLPNIADPGVLGRATDELPQSAAGRTIMTTEPKFIPEEAVAVALKAEEQGVARLKLSRNELKERAEFMIARSQNLTADMMKTGYIKDWHPAFN